MLKKKNSLITSEVPRLFIYIQISRTYLKIYIKSRITKKIHTKDKKKSISAIKYNKE